MNGKAGARVSARGPVLAFWIALLVMTGGAPAVKAADADIQAFFGHYKGQSISGTDGETNGRLFDVKIRDVDDAVFEVEWSTTLMKSDGRVKENIHVIAFKKTARDGIFASAQRRDMFGNTVPFDPMNGDPYVWARLLGNTLSVFALHITDVGGYEMQTYDRTLTDGGLDLVFTRHRDGVPLRQISGRLTRVQ